MAPSDEDLVAAFQAGDRSAFDALVGRWDRKIQGAIYRVLGPGEDARDLCQEVLLKAYRALGGFKKEARFSSWLYQIALNACRDRLRRRRGRTHVGLEELDTADTGRGLAPPTALELIEGRDLARAVEEALQALPEEQREVIALKEYQADVLETRRGAGRAGFDGQDAAVSGSGADAPAAGAAGDPPRRSGAGRHSLKPQRGTRS